MPFPEPVRKQVGKDRGWVCEDCKKRWSDGWLMEVHHILPSSLGGSDEPSNARILCVSCHLKAHERMGHPHSPSIIRARLARTGGRWR